MSLTNVFTLKDDDYFVILCFYIDDILIFGSKLEMILEVEEYLSGNFNMKDLGEADMIFRMKESKTPRDITLSLSHSIEKMLKKFNYYDCQIE